MATWKWKVGIFPKNYFIVNSDIYFRDINLK